MTSLLRSARILRRVLEIAVSQTPMKNHQLTLMGKNSKDVNKNKMVISYML